MRDMVEAPIMPLHQELNKARDKISKELEQLPAHKPGIIVIPTTENHLFFAFHSQQIIVEIAEELRQYSNLLCAALHHSCSDGEQEQSVATFGAHAFATTITNLTTDRTALVMNESFGLSIASTRLRKCEMPFLLSRTRVNLSVARFAGSCS